MDNYNEFIYKRTYARFNNELGRREGWNETVDRWFTHMPIHAKLNNEQKIYLNHTKKQMLDMDVLPAMRTLWTAGEALYQNHIGAFNCAYTAIDKIESFSEILYILMHGTGVGLSVEKRYTEALPIIKEKIKYHPRYRFIIEDSKEGWKDAVLEQTKALYEGRRIDFVYNQIREAGAPLKTFGGRASGYKPLKELLDFMEVIFDGAINRKLYTWEVADIACMIAKAVIVGGVRRCMPYNAMVQTDRGMIMIKDVMIGDNVVVAGKSHKVIDSGFSGKKQTMTINHKFGKIECTPEHQIAIFDNANEKYSFKKAKDITIDDMMVWDLCGFDGMEIKYPELIQGTHHNSKHVKLPKNRLDFSWLIGNVHGDGHVSKGSIAITTAIHEVDILNKAKSIFNEMGITANISDGHGKCFRVRANSKAMANWFSENIKKPNENINIPKFIFNGTRDERFAYLAGLFDADGRVRSDGVIEQVTTIYETLKDDVVSMLSGLGIGCSVYNVISKKENHKDAYSINITGVTNKKTWSSEISKYSVSGKTSRILESKGFSDFMYKIKWIDKPIAGYSNGNKITMHKALEGGYINKHSLVPVEIKSIKVNNNRIDTYDIEVDGINAFVSNGILVHNSSLMILSDIDDKDMSEYKNGNFYETHEYRTAANISAVIRKDDDYENSFNDLFDELSKSMSGERGIINANVLSNRANKLGRDVSYCETGVNPCQPKEAKVLTKNGIVEFGDINIGDEIFSEDGWVKVANKWSTGIKSVYKYKTTAGYFLGTENHRVMQNGDKIEVKDAESIDILRGGIDINDIKIDPQDIVDGLIIGDGSIMSWSDKYVHLYIGGNDQCYFDSEISDYIGKCSDNNNGKVYYVKTTITQEELPRTYDRRVPKRFMEDKNKLVGFLRGLYSANGSVVANGSRVTLKAASMGIIEDVQLMLSAIGIKSYYTTNKSKVVKFDNGEYQCRESYDLNITTDRDKFAKYIGFLHQYKNDKINLSNIGKEKSKSYDIISVDYIGEMEVFDITVDGKNHTYWTGGCNVSNCGEMILLNKEFCNLSEVVLRKNESLSKTLQKINTAIYFAIIQSQLTNYKNLSEEWHDNCEKEKLIGVSLTGIYDWLSSDTFINKNSKNDDPICKKINIEKAKQTIKAMKEYGKKIYNTILDTFPNLAGDIRHECIFTIKPSGTASQLVGASSGIKPEQSEYYIRRVRVDAKDPLALLLIESGVEFDYEVGQDETNATTYVFSFYRKSYSDERLTLPNLSVKDQLDIYKLFNDNWIDHNPSATISVSNDEWDIVKDFLLENKDSIGGISFYPRYDGYHKLMPYEEITKEQYDELSKNNVNIDFNELAKYESSDNTEGAKSYACHAGNCEI